MALQDFADLIPHIAIADGRALGAGRWEDEARAALNISPPDVYAAVPADVRKASKLRA